MGQNLKIDEYNRLLAIMDDLCDLMPKVIFHEFFDSNKYLYSLYFEAFNSIKGFCVLLGNGCLIPQAAAILRMAIEQIATIRVLEMHKDIQNEYIEHKKIRFQLKDLDSKQKQERIKEHFLNKMDNNDKKHAIDYLEYGWLKSISKKYGLYELIELSKMQEDNAIQNWKKHLNSFVHGNIEFANINLDIDAPITYSHLLIDVAAKLFDILMVEFHKENNFDFIFDGINFRELFINAYKGTFEEDKSENVY